jgi:dCTP deaminase
MVQSSVEIEESQLQPASLDLRLGAKGLQSAGKFLAWKRKKQWNVSFRNWSSTRSISMDGAVLERGIVYLVELLEVLDLPDSVAAAANPKSSTGRLDVFTRAHRGQQRRVRQRTQWIQGKALCRDIAL